MIQTIDISLIPSENKPVINVSQFDNISRVLRFNVFDDAEMEVPHVFDVGDTVLLNIRKNDNNIVVITGEIITETDPETQEVTEQYLTFELTEQACACVGSNYGEVSITRGSDEVIGSCNFKLIVERSPLSGGVTSQTAIDTLTTQIEQITEEVIGDNYYDKEEVNGLINAVGEAIPTKTSQLQNDSGYITEEDIPTIPTKTSQLQNDSGYITEDDIPTIPTKTSELENDSGFTTIDDNATANDKTWSSDKISDELYALLPVGTASGEIASFNTALAKPLVSCVVDENATRLSKTTGNSTYAPFFRGLVNGSFYAIDLGSLSWEYMTNYGVFRAYIPYTSLTSPCLTIPYEYSIYSYGATRPDKTINTGSQFYGSNRVTIKDDSFSGDADALKNSLTNVYCIYPLIDSLEGISLAEYQTVCDSFEISGNIIDLPYTEMPNTYVGNNNFFTDYGDITVQYKDTIQNYIDTRIQAVSNRSLSMMRTLETLEKSVTLDKSSELERGDNNDDNAR